MNLKEQIQNDIKDAMKGGDQMRRGVLRTINADIKNVEIAKKNVLSDDEVLEVISINAKQHKDSIEQYKKGGRNDLVEQEEKELEILQKYLPEQMSEEKVRKIVQEAIKKMGAAGASDFGKIMGATMKEIKGKADGGLVKKIVEEELKSKD